MAATPPSKFQRSVSRSIRNDLRRKTGQDFALVPKGKGALLMPVPELVQLAGIAKDAKSKDHRDRQDRF